MIIQKSPYMGLPYFNPRATTIDCNRLAINLLSFSINQLLTNKRRNNTNVAYQLNAATTTYSYEKRIPLYLSK
jgi:hypothetical protein